MGERVRPFHCGSQAADWISNNCASCHKGYDHEEGRYNCDLQWAIDEAWLMEDGTVSPEVAARMGITPETKFAYSWRCSEYAHEADAVESRPADAPGQGRLFWTETPND